MCSSRDLPRALAALALVAAGGLATAQPTPLHKPRAVIQLTFNATRLNRAEKNPNIPPVIIETTAIAPSVN